MDIFSSAYALLADHINGVTRVLGIASAVLGGVFFAFSSFVMTALGKLSPPEGIRSMQRINIDVFSWSFMSLFFCLPIVFLVIGVYAVLNLANQNHALQDQALHDLL